MRVRTSTKIMEVSVVTWDISSQTMYFDSDKGKVKFKSVFELMSALSALTEKGYLDVSNGADFKG